MVRHACGARMGWAGGGEERRGWVACLPTCPDWRTAKSDWGSSTALGALSVILLVKPPAGRVHQACDVTEFPNGQKVFPPEQVLNPGA